MKLYKIDVNKTPSYEAYTKFFVIGESINDMLENLYKELFSEEESIPYYLRSSNFRITCLGEFKPEVKTNKILCANYINAQTN